MVEFKIDPVEQSLPRLARWIVADSFHQDQTVEHWGYPNSLFAAWIYDSNGPVMYFVLELAGEFLRLHTQFAPVEEVSKDRIAETILEAWPRIVAVAKEGGAKGIVFESISPSLIQFMKQLGFHYQKENDYLLDFQE